MLPANESPSLLKKTETVADPASWITGVGGFNVQKSRGCRGLHASTIAHQHLVAERQTEVGNASTKMKRT
jgi:hypothetical protein